ncbi:MAG: PspC domain-containing protein [Eubacterium sp.]|nr:PspC domain-containing protein [Eubacterium sp.]
MKKKLYKDRKNEKLCGVCAGLAKYFDMDVTIIRILWIIITLAGGSGVIAYIVCALVMPDEPPEGYTEVEFTDTNE